MEHRSANRSVIASENTVIDGVLLESLASQVVQRIAEQELRRDHLLACPREECPRMRRPFGDALLSIVALAILLFALVSVDERVREQVSLRLSGRPSIELAAAGAQVRDLTSVVFQAARDQSIEHAPLLMFAVAATVLVVFMLRT
jgi:hypothetical protein